MRGFPNVLRGVVSMHNYRNVSSVSLAGESNKEICNTKGFSSDHMNKVIELDRFPNSWILVVR